MANLKEIRRRIQSVQKNKQITSAMKLVATAKLKKASDNALSAKPFQEKLTRTLQAVAGSGMGEGDDAQPLLVAHEHVKKIRVAMFTSDRGLCGGFNNNLLRKSLPWFDEKREAGVALEFVSYGRKGADFLKSRGMTPEKITLDWARKPKMEMVSELCDEAVQAFLNGEIDELWLVYNTYKNAITQIPTYKRVLPMSVEGAPDDGSAEAGPEYRYEPDSKQVLGALLPLYLRTVVLKAFLETEAGEHAARMTAMDNATRNASDMIAGLTLVYNRTRQAAITKEIIEIVSGAEALN